jgi:SH3-like domain-containing protein
MPQQVVVMQDRVDVLSTPNTNGTVLFQLHEGTKACILDVADGWKEIQLDNGNVGWISNDATEDV